MYACLFMFIHLIKNNYELYSSDTVSVYTESIQATANKDCTTNSLT